MATQRARVFDAASLTATVATCSPTSSRTSRVAATSPVSRISGSPHPPDAMANCPISPISRPFAQSPSQLADDCVCGQTASGVPAMACCPIMPTASKESSRNGSARDPPCPVTYSAPAGSSSIRRFMPPPCPSSTTMRVAPPAFSPSTAAATSRVSMRRPCS